MFLDPEYGGVNMSVAQLEAWIDNPNHRLASTATGLNSLSRLPDFVQKPESRWTRADYAFAKKVLNFNRRHAQQVINAFREDRTGGFGREVGKSGWSKRHIALRNWGHDPSDPDSPLYAADQEWLDEHLGAESRRNPRASNPSRRESRMNPLKALHDLLSEIHEAAHVAMETNDIDEWNRLTSDDGILTLASLMQQADQYLTDVDPRYRPFSSSERDARRLVENTALDWHLGDDGYSRIGIYLVDHPDRFWHLDRQLSRPRVIERWDTTLMR